MALSLLRSSKLDVAGWSPQGRSYSKQGIDIRPWVIQRLTRSYAQEGGSEVTNVSTATAVVPTPFSDMAKAMRATKKMSDLQYELLSALSSLDRGLGATAQDAAHVDRLAQKLEQLGGPVELMMSAAASDPEGEYEINDNSSAPRSEQLRGMWRLVYSSGFNTGSLGGRRPGPPPSLVPATLGQVYQRITPETGHLDNIVELILNLNPPFPLPLLFGAGKEEKKEDLQSPTARLTLRHDYEILGGNTVQIIFEKTFVELLGSDMFAALPKLGLPDLPDPLKPPKGLRAGVFEVTLLTDTMRITRGDLGELRIFLKEKDAEPIPVPAYLDNGD